MQIGKSLEADGILTAAGKARWRPETLKKILQNEKYIGDALLQKTYTVDFLTKKRVKNNGIVPQYYVENSHEALIPRDLYIQAQEEMVRRANLHSERIERKESTAVSTHYRALFIVQGAEIFTEGLHGTTVASTPSYGDVSAEWNMVHQNVMHRPFRK